MTGPNFCLFNMIYSNCSFVSTWNVWLCDVTDCYRFLLTGLDSDESYEGVSEASFKDAQLFDCNSRKNNGSVPQENGIKKHRYSCIPAPHSSCCACLLQVQGRSSLNFLNEASSSHFLLVEFTMSFPSHSVCHEVEVVLFITTFVQKKSCRIYRSVYLARNDH